MKSDSQLVTLKAELKAWESAFRKEHAREPTKADIKAVPAISDKYKLYAKVKAGPASTAPPRSARPASSSRVSSHPHSTFSSAPVPGPSSLPADSNSIFKTPTKPKRRAASQASHAPTALGSPTKSPFKPTYVIANSPSKLRALAAAHSASSPNHRPTNGSGVGVVIGSPRKHNPFRVGGGSDEVTGQSPVKASRGVEEMELERGGGASQGGLGWESVFSGPRSGSSASVEGRSRGTSVVELDEVRIESLGPSPVKPSANGKARAFKPLLPPPPSISVPKVAPPKLFETGSKVFSNNLATDADAKPSSSKSNPSHHPSLAPLRGIKRSSTVALPFDSEQSVEDALEEEAGSKKKGKKVVKTRVRKPKRARLLGAGEEEDDVEMDDVGRETKASMRRRNEKGVLVLELDEEGEEGRTDRVVIHPRRPYYKSKGKDVDEDVDGDEDDDVVGGSQGSLFYRDTADLLSSQSARLPTASFDSDNDTSRHSSRLIDVDPTIPSELVSMLSLRSSPIKKTSLLRDKDRDLRVKKLLQEPSVTGKKKRGLEDLVDERGSEGEEEQGGSDDDWASDAEGWKDFGDGAMDGFDDSS